MISGFKAFVMRGNVIDLAVAVIVGAAFLRIVTSLTEDVIMPLIGWMIGDMDFSSYFIRLGALPPGFSGNPGSYAALKEAGVATIGYGTLLTAIVNFLLVAFVVYLLVRGLKRMVPDKDVPVDAEPADVALLREIRDELRAGRAASPSTSH